MLLLAEALELVDTTTRERLMGATGSAAINKVLDQPEVQWQTHGFCKRHSKLCSFPKQVDMAAWHMTGLAAANTHCIYTNIAVVM